VRGKILVKKTPLVTVLMSVHNGEKWIANSIESVLAQTYRDLEFIIVDDGSTDSSIRIISNYASSDSRIKVLSKSNTGLTDSLNRGLLEARGEWVARIDSDDICDPNRIQMQLAVALSDSDIVLVGSGMCVINEQGVEERQYAYPSSHSAMVDRLTRAGSFFPHSSALFRLNAASQIGGYRVQFSKAQDLDLWLRLSEVGKVITVPEPLVYIRKHEGQISANNESVSQLAYAAMAVASYWIRGNGSKDPIESDNPDQINRFLHFCDKKLQEHNVYVKEKYILEFKKSYKNEDRLFGKWLIVLLFFVNKPLILLGRIKNRYFGSSIHRDIARSWFK
jgi:glycosyltransferase involved in cell wall biosynthesis